VKEKTISWVIRRESRIELTGKNALTVKTRRETGCRRNAKKSKGTLSSVFEFQSDLKASKGISHADVKQGETTMTLDSKLVLKTFWVSWGMLYNI
jgi:hypothetical protein